MILQGQAVPDASSANTSALRITRLDRLMSMTSGSTDVVVGLPDGPIDADHPDLVNMGFTSRSLAVTPSPFTESTARQHGTFVAGLLASRRESSVPGICPGCPIVTVPIFGNEARNGIDVFPSQHPPGSLKQ